MSSHRHLEGEGDEADIVICLRVVYECLTAVPGEGVAREHMCRRAIDLSSSAPFPLDGKAGFSIFKKASLR